MKVGQQAEMQVLVAIGEEADFERFDQVLDVVRAVRACVGTTTSVRHVRRNAVAKNPCAAADAGVTSNVASQFTSATAS